MKSLKYGRKIRRNFPFVKKGRCDDMEGDEDNCPCVTAVASIANNEKERKERAKDK